MSSLDQLTDAELDHLGHAIKSLMVNIKPGLRVTDILSPKELHMMHRVFRWLDPSPWTPSTVQTGGTEPPQTPSEPRTGTIGQKMARWPYHDKMARKGGKDAPTKEATTGT